MGGGISAALRGAGLFPLSLLRSPRDPPFPPPPRSRSDNAAAEGTRRHEARLPRSAHRPPKSEVKATIRLAVTFMFTTMFCIETIMSGITASVST